MTVKAIIGTIISYLYNNILTYVPSRRLRHLFISCWFSAFGDGCGVQMRVRILNGRKIQVGKRVVVNWGCVLDGRKYAITIGNDVSLGPECTIITLGHDPQSPDFEDRGGEVIIGDRAWIGQRAMILPGVNVGEGAVIAAGAVVSKDVDPFSIVAGTPAKTIGTRNRNLKYELDYRPWLT